MPISYNKSGYSSSVITCTDLSRLSRTTAFGFLEYLVKRDTMCLAMAIFFFSTGITPSRPFKLNKRGTLSVKGQTVLVSRIHTHPCIHYGIINGATDRESTDESYSMKAILSFSLPIHIYKTLRYLLKKNQLQKTLDKIDRLARDYAENNPGLTPTLSRLARSNDLLFSYRHFSVLETQVVNGAMRANMGAAGDYVQHDIAKLNQQYRYAFQDFIDACPASTSLGKYLASLDFNPQLPCGTVGSQIDIQFDDYATLLSAIRKQFNEKVKQLDSCSPSTRLALLTECLNLQNAYCYVLKLVGTSTRPIGEKKQIALTVNFGICSREKDSKHHIELSYSPLVPTLLDQYLACHHTLLHEVNNFTHDATFHPSLDPDTLQPARYVVLKSRTQLHHRRMRHKDFKTVMQRHGLGHLKVVAMQNNAHRHLLSTYLHQHLPHSVVEEFLSHKVNAHDYVGPWSTGTFTALQQLEHVLEQKLKRLSPTPLTMESTS